MPNLKVKIKEFLKKTPWSLAFYDTCAHVYHRFFNPNHLENYVDARLETYRFGNQVYTDLLKTYQKECAHYAHYPPHRGASLARAKGI
ncbi:hypothetical protein NHP190003_15760 [Helicobacter sp. NHP19-003]|uniref:Uncharacterized protein n=1 Tax=Helicobacter gastrocanis TaxID=2849641 RepID=A0ABM7SC93_9HELI|nr:hypothetical protein [Helicobacter sp. NHP19-003]BCZ18294.1 hypothetical protein NHP190003_15760 [Helicobacter sp. NHP19-003]